MTDKQVIISGALLFCCGFLGGATLSGMIVSQYCSDYWLKKLEYHNLAEWDDRKSQYIPIWEQKVKLPVDSVASPP